MTELEDQKIQAEIAKLNAETDVYSLQKRKWQLDVGELEADAKHFNNYMFYGAVTEARVRECIETLDLWSRQRPDNAMTITLCSPGGLVFTGLALYDFIQELRARGHHITVKCIGMGASMGSILLQAGDKRVMTKNSYVMIHEVSNQVAGTYAEIEDQQRLTKSLHEKLDGILCERSTFTPRSLRARIKRQDLWLDADQCLELGLVDEVQ